MTTTKPEPASDAEIADTFSRANTVTAIGSVRALKLIARIRELEEELENARMGGAGRNPHAAPRRKDDRRG